ncbi:hypothetical protein V8E52_007248 [Russula decolorans]
MPEYPCNQKSYIRKRVEKEKWTGEVATKVTQKLINWIFQDRHHTDPTLRATLRTPSRRCKRNMPKRERMMDRTVDMVRYSSLLQSNPNGHQADGRRAFRARRHPRDARNVHVVTLSTTIFTCEERTRTRDGPRLQQFFTVRSEARELAYGILPSEPNFVIILEMRRSDSEETSVCQRSTGQRSLLDVWLAGWLLTIVISKVAYVHPRPTATDCELHVVNAAREPESDLSRYWLSDATASLGDARVTAAALVLAPAPAVARG